MLKIQIKNRFTGSIIFEYEKEKNTIAETVKEFIRQEIEVNKKSKANLSEADLSKADLSEADLSKANLSKANLSEANLSVIKNDFWSKLIKLKNEIPAFKEKIKEGKINGSCYDGECCCFVGSFANIKHIDYRKLDGVYPDSGSPTERWFLAFKEGDTPENSQVSKITMDWILEFEMWLNK